MYENEAVDETVGTPNQDNGIGEMTLIEYIAGYNVDENPRVNYITK